MSDELLDRVKTQLPTILVVEDEALIATLLTDFLNDAGFATEVVASAGDAINFLDTCAGHLCAVVTDIRLVGSGDGWDVARHARHVNGAIAVVYVTADSADEWTEKGVPNSLLVQKPFAPAQVVTAVSTLVTARSTAQSSGISEG